MATTLWTKGQNKAPLYSDWSVSFITTTPSKNAKGRTDSLSTASLSSEESLTRDEEREEQSTKDQTESRQEDDAVFCVHRNMIGPKSAFFTESFLNRYSNGAKTESSSSSTIALPSDLPAHTFASVVEAFELLLGYCYNGNENFEPKEKLTTDNAVAMFCLCNYFKMNSEICDMVMDFIKSDLSYETIAKYYQIVRDMRPSCSESIVLDAKQITEMVVNLCYRSPCVLDSQTDLFKIADLSLWLSIGSLLANDDAEKDEASKATSAEASKVWSENLISFFENYPETAVDELKDSFQALTAENILPEVSPKAALRLLEHERKYGFSELTSKAKKAKELEEDDASQDTISTTYDSDVDVVVEEELLGTSALTNLQKRCIKALCESNWAGKENDVEQMRGQLVSITTSSVLETLLIDSVTGERALNAKMTEMRTDIELEKAHLQMETEAYEFKRKESMIEVAKEKQKQMKLEYELSTTRKELESTQRKLKKLEGRVQASKAELCKANAILEAELEAANKKNYSLDVRCRAVVSHQNKVETDREMFEMTIKETIKQLDAITTYEEEYGFCGLGHIIMLISAISDRKECEHIKYMLQQVVKDPLTYERDFLSKTQFIEEVETNNDDKTTCTALTADSKDV